MDANKRSYKEVRKQINDFYSKTKIKVRRSVDIALFFFNTYMAQYYIELTLEKNSI